MPTITLKDGVLSAETYVQVTREHQCNCGESLTLTLNMPEGVTFNSQITVNKDCPTCGDPIVIPRGEHYIEDYKLLTK
jgi:hypothetical protein